MPSNLKCIILECFKGQQARHLCLHSTGAPNMLDLDYYDCNVYDLYDEHRSNRCLVTELSPSESCNSEITELTEASGNIVSPGYFLGNYPNNAKCKWRIRVKENKVNNN